MSGIDEGVFISAPPESVCVSPDGGMDIDSGSLISPPPGTPLALPALSLGHSKVILTRAERLAEEQKSSLHIIPQLNPAVQEKPTPKKQRTREELRAALRQKTKKPEGRRRQIARLGRTSTKSYTMTDLDRTALRLIKATKGVKLPKDVERCIGSCGIITFMKNMASVSEKDAASIRSVLNQAIAELKKAADE